MHNQAYRKILGSLKKPLHDNFNATSQEILEVQAFLLFVVYVMVTVWIHPTAVDVMLKMLEIMLIIGQIFSPALIPPRNFAKVGLHGALSAGPAAAGGAPQRLQRAQRGAALGAAGGGHLELGVG